MLLSVVNEKLSRLQFCALQVSEARFFRPSSALRVPAISTSARSLRRSPVAASAVAFLWSLSAYSRRCLRSSQPIRGQTSLVLLLGPALRAPGLR